MNLNLNVKLAEKYKSSSQIARILTEDWVKQNSYCPKCGLHTLLEFENNRPVADFFCKICDEQFELKSKNGKLGSVINDGAYDTMISRINSETNPHFFLLTYTKSYQVDNFLIIPKHFFQPGIIQMRKPLGQHAKRAGWVGCNIDLSGVTKCGKIYIIENSKVVDPQHVQLCFNKTAFLACKSEQSKGWLLDVLGCVESLKNDHFSLSDIYTFEPILQQKYPNNKFIKDKIRQQLQILRDKDLIEFRGRGSYRKKI